MMKCCVKPQKGKCTATVCCRDAQDINTNWESGVCQVKKKKEGFINKTKGIAVPGNQENTESKLIC